MNRTHIIPTALCIYCGMFAALSSCGTRDTSPTVARVGSEKLTLTELRRSIPPEYSNRITREQNIFYVKQWIDNELLYQEALRQKIHREPSIRNRLEKMRKDLLCAELISRKAIASRDVPISDAMIREYYERNKDRFIREKDVAKYMQIVVDRAKTAWQVRERVTRHNFLDLASQYSKLPVQDPRTVPYTPLDELPPQIADVIGSIRINGTSSPVKTSQGYHLIRVVDKKYKGAPCVLEEVRETIINELSTQTQKAELDRFLSQLREKADVEKNFELIPAPARPYSEKKTQ